MDLSRIAALLQPFITPSSLNESQLNNISTYIDILLRWNARMNLTAVRAEESIVTRHFGESLFAARTLFPAGGRQLDGVESSRALLDRTAEGGCPYVSLARVSLADVGSGAGFPGLPIKLWRPEIEVTLIESNHKKATFLREVIRKLGLTGAEVFAGRAQDFSERAEIVTLRAVEKFEEALVASAELVAPEGKLAVLIGEQQVSRAEERLSNWKWEAAASIAQSGNRVLLIGTRGTSLDR